MLGVVVAAGLMLIADVRRVIPLVDQFRWQLLPFVLLLTLGNYILRFLKWHWYLRWVGVDGLKIQHSLLIFFAGFAMSITPGKVGEWVKAYLVGRLVRESAAPIVPVVAMERVTDGLAMLILGIGSAVVGIGWGWQPLVLVLAALLTGLWVLQEQRVVGVLTRWASHVPLIRRRVDTLDTMYRAARELLRWRRLMLIVCLSVCSWSLECVGLYLILVGLGLEPHSSLLMVATFVLSTASIAGALSLLPGGLGAAEAGIAGLLVLLRPDIGTPTAATATLLIRLSTLWFGVLLGMVSLLGVQRWFLSGAE